MRLFLLERTPLNRVMELAKPPLPGDLVAYTRAAQDPTGQDAIALEKLGIQVMSTDGLLSMSDARAIHEMGEKFTNTWYLDSKDEDKSLYHGISIGDLIAYEIICRINPLLIYRLGELCRQLIKANKAIDGILSDITDGISLMKAPGGLPVNQAVKAAAEQLGHSFTPLIPVNPLPHRTPEYYPFNTINSIFKQFIGGMRPNYIVQRMKICLKRVLGILKPSVYILWGRGQNKLIEKLVATKQYQVVVSQTGLSGTLPLRHDHLFALPGLKGIRLKRLLKQNLETIAKREINPQGEFAYQGIDYGPLLAGAALKQVQSSLFLYLIIVSQIVRAQKLGCFKAIVINGLGAMAGQTALANINQTTNVPVYFTGHGVNTFRVLSRCIGRNQRNVTYLASGEDHIDEYGVHLPRAKKPKVKAIGNITTQLMLPVLGRRSKAHQKRLLILNFAISISGATGRVYVSDQYLLDTFECARRLVDEGWTIRYRTHPGLGTDLEQKLLATLGLTEKVKFDQSPAFTDSLLECDVVVSNFSTAYYQALYAGWPVIFHEPLYDTHNPNEFLDEFHTGVMSATDIDRPISRNQQSLYSLIKDSLDPESLTSLFPEQFSSLYKHRFIGDQPDQVDAHIADYIINDLNKRLK
jgi:hypothetical protein